MSNGMKLCGSCKLPKPQADFKKDNKIKCGYSTLCKACDNANHRDRRKRRSVQQLKRDRRRGIEYNRVRNYGLSPNSYAALLIKQDNVCAICGCPETRIIKGTISTLSVDHNHVDGRIRGLLCDVCNKVLGLLKDNPDLFRKAATYLESA